MVAKFRESTIKALNAKLSEGSSAEVFEVFEAERVPLRSAPDVTPSRSTNRSYWRCANSSNTTQR